MSKRVLKKVANGKLSPIEALNQIYGSKPRAGRFIKLKMIIKDHMFVSGFVNTLFFFPIPIWLGKPFIIKGLKEADMDIGLYDIIRNYSGGTKVIVKSEQAKIKIVIL